MSHIRTALTSVAIGAAAIFTAGAHAASNADLAYHPALAKARPASVAVDASTFIPGHPARGATGFAPATAPAVATVPAPKATARGDARAVAAAR